MNVWQEGKKGRLSNVFCRGNSCFCIIQMIVIFKMKGNMILFFIVAQDVWVLKPQVGIPSAIVHFVGGVFVGAAPQLTYRLFLERLADRYDAFICLFNCRNDFMTRNILFLTSD